MKVKIPYDNKIKLSGRLNTIHKSKTIVILVHGFTTSKDHDPIPKFEKLLHEVGLDSLAIDLYGHGESDGKFEDITLTRGGNSILKSIEFLKNNGYEEKNIGLLGESFGGNCSVLAAAKSRLGFLVLKSPVSNYKEVEEKRRTKKQLEFWEENGFIEFTNGFVEEKRLSYSFYSDISNHDTYKESKVITCPTLILHGYEDNIVPVSQSRRLNGKITNSKLKTYEGAGHKIQNSSKGNKMYEDIIDFLIGQTDN